MSRILIVDDDKKLCNLIKRSISYENIEADSCHSGTEALIFLDKKEYQLIILDIMMPGPDGFQTMEEIRRKSNIPILMLTSKNDNISKIKGLRSGADDYLTKPFDMDGKY